MIVFIIIQAAGKADTISRIFYRTYIRLNPEMLKTRNRENILSETCMHRTAGGQEMSVLLIQQSPQHNNRHKLPDQNLNGSA